MERYLTHSKGKFAVAERFTRTLKSKIYSHTTGASKNEHINEINEIVDTYH